MGSRYERVERFERPERNERPERPERVERLERNEKPEREDRLNRSEKYEEKDSLNDRVPPRGLKSGLKSPETDRRKKSVSWSQECTPQGKKENESGQKRKRTDADSEFDQ